MPSKNELTILIKLRDLASRGFRRMGRAASKSFKNIIGGLSRLTQKLSRMSTMLFAVSAGFVTLAGIRLVRLAKEFDLVAKSATRFGLTTESVTEMRFAAEQSGVAMGDLKMAMQRLNRTAEQVKDGNINIKRQFEALGIEARSLFKEGGPTDLTAVLARIADGMGTVESSTERVDIAFQLLGDSGPKLLTLLDGGAEKVKALAKEAKDLGQVLGEEQVEMFAAFLSALDKFKRALQGVEIAIASKILPGLTKAFSDWADEIATNRKQITTELLTLLVDGGKTIVSFGEVFGIALTAIAFKLKVFLSSLQSLLVLFNLAKAAFASSAGQEKAKAALKDLRQSVESSMRTLNSLLDTIKNPGAVGDKLKRLLDPFEVMLAKIEASQNFPVVQGQSVVAPRKPTTPAEELTELQKLTGGLGKGLEELRIKFNDTFEVARSAAISAGNALQSGIQDQLEGIILGTQTLQDAWKAMGKLMLKILAQVIAKLITARLTMLLLGGIVGATSTASSSGPGPGAGTRTGGSGGSESQAGGGGGGNMTVNLTILANDAKGFDRLLQERKKTIEDLVINALQTRRDVIVDFRGR